MRRRAFPVWGAAPRSGWRTATTDIDGNVRAEQVTVCIGSDECPAEAGDSTGGDESSTGADENTGDASTGDDGGSTTGSDDDDGGGTDPAPIDPSGLGQNVEPDTGCQCRAESRGAGVGALLPLLLLGLVRRRSA